MGTSPEHDGNPPEGQETPTRAPASGVRTEHQLRVQLRQALERNTTLERALRESAAYAYGRRDQADLRKLRAVLSAAGFRDPSVKRSRDEDEDATPTASAGG
jgi:hypothetical protein